MPCIDNPYGSGRHTSRLAMIYTVIILGCFNLWNDSAPIDPRVRASDISCSHSSDRFGGFIHPYLNFSNGIKSVGSCKELVHYKAIAPKNKAISSYASSVIRAHRFPTVFQRVRFYMSSWYEPPCDESELLEIVEYVGNENHEGKTLVAGSQLLTHAVPADEQDGVEAAMFLPSYSFQRQTLLTDTRLSVAVRATSLPGTDLVFVLTKSTLDLCEFNPLPEQRKSLQRVYCRELRDNLLLPFQKQTNQTGDLAVLLAQVGDSLASKIMNEFGSPTRQKQRPSIPHFKKVRRAWDNVTGRDLMLKISTKSCAALETRRTNNQNLEPIIWKMGVKRHYGKVSSVPEKDIPWEEKRNAGVFRGTTTGLVHPETSPRERCLKNPRCRLVLMYHNSSYVDAKFTTILDSSKLPPIIDNITISGESLSMEDQLKYKALIFMEGNDVSTGLKWGLYSNSVVMITKPSISSWAMEELLEPYVHYVPLRDDLSDVETQMKWIVEHDREAKEIALRGQLWMHDLLYAEESERDNAAINEEILRRYQTHFRPGIAVKEELLFYPKPER